jgi:hypothetical protein
MGRHRDSRLQLRFLGPGPRGQAECDDGRVAQFDGWTDLGRAIQELAGPDIDPLPENLQPDPEGDQQ